MQDFRMDTFLAVCKYMNYTKAANALSLTQPAVSQHIRYLENAYGVPLFEQSGKKIFLTKAGEILYRAALTMKHDEEHMKQRMLHTRIKTQNYSFGATLTVAEFMLLDDLKSFILSHPQSRIRMQVENTRELLRRLDSSEIDFAIVEGDFPRDEYEFLPYKTEEYAAVASPEKAAFYKNACIKDLLGEPLLLRESGSGTREIMEQWLLQQGLNIDCFAGQIELGNIRAINSLLKTGAGISFCYRAAIRQEEQKGELAVIPLRDLALSHEIMFIFRKGSIFKDDYIEIYQKLCGRKGSRLQDPASSLPAPGSPLS